jgi:hypothetical protein
MGELLMATPAISDGVIFVRGQSHLFAIGEPAAAAKPAAKAKGKEADAVVVSSSKAQMKMNDDRGESSFTKNLSVSS